MRKHYDRLLIQTACFLLALALPSVSSADAATDLFRNVLTNANLCAYGKDIAQRTDCYINAAPKKCEAESRKFLATQNREFFVCVSSCVNAGVISNSVGECSRDLDLDNAGEILAEKVRQAEAARLNFYWDQASKAEFEVSEKYPYLKNPSSAQDHKAVSNFEYLKRQYLTVGADSYGAVHRAARETDEWHSRVTKKSREEKLEKVVQLAYQRYPFLDVEGAQANRQAIDEVIKLRDYYISRGWSVHEGLERAVSEVAPKYQQAQIQSPAQNTAPQHQAPPAPQYPYCEYKQIMTDEDMRACGLESK